MQYRRRSGGLALLLLLLLVMTAVPVTAASARDEAAAPKTSSTQPRSTSKPKPKPKPGWLVERVRIESLEAGGTVAVNGVGEYRGVIDVVPTANGTAVAVVNEVGLEDYVRGLAEVPSSWPLEAQKAQAIAARTYALHELNLDPRIATAARAVGAQICATDACQVYAGVAKERNPETAATFGVWTTAVEQTKNEVVLFQNVPINAKYSSSNGGRSISGGRPYLRVIEDPDDRFSPLHRWRSEILGTDVAAALGLTGGVIHGLSRAGDMIAVDWRGPDGNGDRLTVHVNDFRARVNAVVPPPPGLPRPVPFPRFTPTADASTNTVLLEGGGWGHGIGMSQWGAYGKAMRGMKAPDILAAYYSGLRPTRVEPAKLPKSIRVAVDLGRPVVELGGGTGPATASSATGATRAATAATASALMNRFRILDQAGAPIAVAASGNWRIVPEGNAVRVLPPPGQEAAPALEPLAIEPAAPTPDGPVTLRFRLTAPAVVRMTMVDETGAEHAVGGPRLLEPGDRAHQLPATQRPGRYTVTVTADSGGGRTATLPVVVDVRPARASVIGPRRTTDGNDGDHDGDRGARRKAATGLAALTKPNPTEFDRNAAAALAATLLLLVGTAAAQDWRSTRPTTLERLSSRLRSGGASGV